jgi:hypothetical protein
VGLETPLFLDPLHDGRRNDIAENDGAESEYGRVEPVSLSNTGRLLYIEGRYGTAQIQSA